MMTAGVTGVDFATSAHRLSGGREDDGGNMRVVRRWWYGEKMLKARTGRERIEKRETINGASDGGFEGDDGVRIAARRRLWPMPDD